METTSTNYSSDIATIEEDNQEEIWGTLDIPRNWIDPTNLSLGQSQK